MILVIAGLGGELLAQLVGDLFWAPPFAQQLDHHGP